MTRSAIIALAVGGTLAGTLAAGAQEYYRQNPVDSFGGYSSQDARNPGGLGWFSEVADNFPGQAGWSINHVEFWGGYASDPATPGNTRGFTIRFYTDNGGHPGTRVFEQDVTEFTRTQYYVTPPLPPTFPNGLAGYHYELDLSPPFVISSSAQYWISVVAILDRGGGANEPQWGWIQTAGVNPPSAEQWFFSPGNFAPVGVDTAFVLAQSAAGCRADINGDGLVNVQDFLGFLQLFAAADPRADFDDSGAVNVSDFLAFLQAFAAGC
jgi:hypothetical protein